MLNLIDKSTYAYKEYVKGSGVSMENSKLSRPTPEVHRIIESSAQLGLKKGRKKSVVKRDRKKKKHKRIHKIGEEGMDEDTTRLYVYIEVVATT